MELDDIKELLVNNKVDDAIKELKTFLSLNKDNDDAYFTLGNAYCRLNDWRQALNAYCKALAINPDSAAKEAYNHVQEILDFFNHDLYNP